MQQIVSQENLLLDLQSGPLSCKETLDRKSQLQGDRLPTDKMPKYSALTECKPLSCKQLAQTFQGHSIWTRLTVVLVCHTSLAAAAPHFDARTILSTWATCRTVFVSDILIAASPIQFSWKNSITNESNPITRNTLFARIKKFDEFEKWNDQHDVHTHGKISMRPSKTGGRLPGRQIKHKAAVAQP